MPAQSSIVPGERSTIAVRVYRAPSYPDYSTGDNPISDDYAITYKPVDYWPYAGITRSVRLEATPEVVISKVKLRCYQFSCGHSEKTLQALSDPWFILFLMNYLRGRLKGAL
jgi:hypothetical protein